MLVDEYSTSVDTMKKEPSFAKMKAGNANRTNKQKEVHPIWTKKVYHIRVGYVVELQIPHCTCAQVSQKSDLRKAKKGYQENTADAL